MINQKTQAFGFYHGASWMDREGKIYLVPGFHEEWIHAHPELAQDCNSVLEMVLYKGWISVVVFSQGYVEICLNEISDDTSTGLIYEFLLRNGEKWKNALLMPMREEGFIQIARDELGEVEDFRRHLRRAMEKKAN